MRLSCIGSFYNANLRDNFIKCGNQNFNIKKKLFTIFNKNKCFNEFKLLYTQKYPCLINSNCNFDNYPYYFFDHLKGNFYVTI